jgi:hypothetical protein
MEKTRLIEFGRFAAGPETAWGRKTLDVHILRPYSLLWAAPEWRFHHLRVTAKKRMVAKLRQIKAEFRRRMHDPVALVGERLKRVTLGYYNYYAVPGNIDRLNIFAQRLRRLWRLILSRRSQRSCSVGSVAPDLSALDSSTSRSPCLSS